MTIGGVFYLWATTNWLTAALAALTSVSYLLVYTPMKHVHPICTFLGAFPGAMPPCSAGPRFAGGSTVRQWCCSPSFSSGSSRTSTRSPGCIAKTTRTRGVRMLPVVESDGRSTAHAIVDVRARAGTGDARAHV